MNQVNVLSRRHVENATNNKTCLYADCEERLNEWFLEQRDQNNVVSTISLQSKMIELVEEMHPLESNIFKASRGWMQNFMKRRRLAFRRITSSGRELPKNTFEIIKSFLKDVEQTI